MIQFRQVPLAVASNLWKTGFPSVVLSIGALLVFSGCSIRSLAIDALADSLAESGDVYAADDDPELVRDATPFALKTIESLLAEKPDHRTLLLTACRGFAQYAYAFVETEAERLEEVDFEASERQYERALNLYLRARDYCLRSLELDHPGVTADLTRQDPSALIDLQSQDVELLFWTGASWGGAISVGQDRPELVADLPTVRALMDRALELDESYEMGAIHAVLIALDALPEAMGGSPERAREHFDRAVELSSGRNATPYVTLAESVAVAEQDWEEFQNLLETALAIDPDLEPSIRLANIIAQEKARWLLDRTGDFFFTYPGDD